jgi:hypothetical protein
MAERKLQLLLSNERWGRLIRLSQAEGVSPSDLLRELLDAAWEASEIARMGRGEYADFD